MTVESASASDHILSTQLVNTASSKQAIWSLSKKKDFESSSIYSIKSTTQATSCH